MRASQRGEREEIKATFIDTMFKNFFLKLIKDLKLQIQEAIQTLSKTNKENQIQAYLIQTAINQTLGENLKGRQEKKNVITLNSNSKTYNRPFQWKQCSGFMFSYYSLDFF